VTEVGRVWQLVRSDELLAELVVTGGDFPWLNAKVRPAAGFAEVRPLLIAAAADSADEPIIG